MITQAIQATTRANADKVAAEAQVAVAKARADTQVEQARGQAESNRLIAQSIAANPEIVRLRAIEKWNGQLPTYTGSGPMPFLDVK